MSYKQKQFARSYIKHRGNGTQAALESYACNYESARAIASQNLARLHIREHIDQLLETRDGLTLENALESLSECVHTKPKGEGSYSDKLAATKLLLKLHKAIPGEQQPTTTTVAISAISAHEIAARVAAQEADVPHLDPELD